MYSLSPGLSNLKDSFQRVRYDLDLHFREIQ